MSLRLVHRMMCPVAVLAAGLAGMSPAGAVTAPSWQISEVVPRPFTILQGLATSGPDNAVVVGTTTQKLVVQQWNGTAWQAIAPPRQFGHVSNASVNAGPVGTSAPDNTWLFITAGPNSNIEYALHWNGTAWTVTRLSATKSVLGTAVFSPTNVWSFGTTNAGPDPSGGFGPAWVRRFNGTSWRQVTLPGTPVDISTLSATDIWAMGPSANTVHKPTQVYIAMHWNGTAWRSLALPKLAPVNGQPWVPDAIVATAPNQLWMDESIAVNRGTGVQPPGFTLLHWDGTAWSTVVQDLTAIYAPELASDGQGGFWLDTNDDSQPTNSIVHYTGGQFVSQPAPTEPGFTSQAGGFTLIPGTTSLWGLGFLTSADGHVTKSDILNYGP
jgi:hypothetical protein